MSSVNPITRLPPAELAEAFSELLRNGVAFLPRFLPEQVVMDMRDGLPPIEEFKGSLAAERSVVLSGADSSFALISARVRHRSGE
jgi:hypothetical protein